MRSFLVLDILGTVTIFCRLRIHHEVRKCIGIVFIIGGGEILCGGIGALCVWRKPKDPVLYAREGFVIVSLSWIMLSLFGAIPFCISGVIPNYVDAVFETVSGFTTTGASILTDVEAMEHGLLFWRSFTHWIGGMGVLVFVLAVVPMNGGSHMNLMRAESPGPNVGKLVPKMRKTAAILYFKAF